VIPSTEQTKYQLTVMAINDTWPNDKEPVVYSKLITLHFPNRVTRLDRFQVDEKYRKLLDRIPI
jgi:hypothetical protein